MTMRKIRVESRSEAGKGISRKIRAEGNVPAALYGAGKDPVKLSANAQDIRMSLQDGGLFTSMQELDIDGKSEKVLARDVQYHPVTGQILHMDFMRFDPKQTIKVAVNVTIIGEEDSPGLVKGGVLQLVRSDIELVCRADNIPQELIVSVEGKDIGDSVHMSDIALPDGVHPSVQDRDFTVASIVGTRTSNMAELDEDGNEIYPEDVEGAEGAEGDAAEGAEGDAADGKEDGKSE